MPEQPPLPPPAYSVGSEPSSDVSQPKRPLRGIVKRQADERRLHELLRPMAEAYTDLANGIEEYARGLPDDVLADHLRACNHMTQTNCWWATYHVAPLVRDAVQREQFRRNRHKFHGEKP